MPRRSTPDSSDVMRVTPPHTASRCGFSFAQPPRFSSTGNPAATRSAAVMKLIECSSYVAPHAHRQSEWKWSHAHNRQPPGRPWEQCSAWPCLHAQRMCVLPRPGTYLKHSQRQPSTRHLTRLVSVSYHAWLEYEWPQKQRVAGPTAWHSLSGVPKKTKRRFFCWWMTRARRFSSSRDGLVASPVRSWPSEKASMHAAACAAICGAAQTVRGRALREGMQATGRNPASASAKAGLFNPLSLSGPRPNPSHYYLDAFTGHHLGADASDTRSLPLARWQSSSCAAPAVFLAAVAAARSAFALDASFSALASGKM